MRASRSTPSVRCAKSWQTPDLASHASAASVVTSVAPWTYRMLSCRNAHTACAKSVGVAESARIDASSASNVGEGETQWESSRYSHHSSCTASSDSHGRRSGTVAVGLVSTSEVATTVSSVCGSLTSNAVTVDPQ
jgi:hypothetical protein